MVAAAASFHPVRLLAALRLVRHILWVAQLARLVPLVLLGRQELQVLQV